MPESALTARALRYTYASAFAPALDGVELDVESGEIFTLLGPNGAGKTTTIDILQGYKSPQAGNVTVLGFDPFKRQRALMNHVGVMLQEPALYPDLKVGEIVALFASYYDAPMHRRDVFRSSGIEHLVHKRVRYLSAGEKRRVALALSLVGDPQVLFLDEPGAGLDPEAREKLWHLIESFKSTGKTVFMTTHLIEEAEALSDRIAIINAGRTVLSGDVASLTHSPGRLEVISSRPIDVDRLTAALPETLIRERGVNSYVAEPVDAKAFMRAIEEQGVDILQFKADRRSLSDVYMDAVQSSR